MLLMPTWLLGQAGSLHCKISNLERVSCGQLVTSLSLALSAYLYYGGLPRSRMIQEAQFHRIPLRRGNAGKTAGMNAINYVSGERKCCLLYTSDAADE